MKRVVSLCLMLSWCSAVFAQGEQRIASPGIAPRSIFTVITTPAPVQTAYPASSGFVVMDKGVFADVTDGIDHIERIPNFPLGGKRVTLLVEEFDVLSHDAKILEGRKSGDRVVAAPKHILLHGSIEGDEGSHVYLAIFNNYTIGYIQPSNDERFLISPIYKTSTEGSSPLICYRETEISQSLKSKPWNCGAEDLPFNQPRLDAMAKEIAEFQSKPQQEIQAITQVNLMRIAIECDYSYYQAHNKNLDESITYAIAVLGTMCDVYLRDVHVGVTSQYLKVWTDGNDPYTGGSPGVLLGQFQSYWNANMTSQPRAAALLFSAKGGGGLAYVGVLCAENIDSYNYAYCGLDNRYVFPADGYIWDTDVSSHELGHNVGSPHTHSCSWNPAVDSCVGAEGSCYPTPKPRKGTIMSYCHLTSYGTEMKIHPRVAVFMRNKTNRAGCLDWVEKPQAYAGSDPHICPGSSVKIGKSVDGGITPYTYLWWPAQGLSQTNTEEVTASPIVTTTYVMRVGDGNGMRTYDTVTVFAEKPTVNAGADITICGVDSVSLTPVIASGYGKLSYQWVDTTTHKVVGTERNIKVVVRKSASFRLTVSDSIGCSNQDVITIHTQSPPFTTLLLQGKGSFCDGGSSMLDAGAGFTSYTWSTGETTRTITVKNSGRYSCIVTTDGIGCIGGSDTITVIRNAPPIPPTITKTNDTLYASIASSYQWYLNGNVISGATDQSFYPLQSGEYLVHIADSNGCVNMSTPFAVTIIPASVSSEVSLTLVKIYPNPAHSQLTIELPTSVHDMVYYISDARGEIVSESKSKKSISLKEIIDIKTFSSGTYFLHYQIGGQSFVSKFVKE